jgi:hypothetical protein
LELKSWARATSGIWLALPVIGWSQSFGSLGASPSPAPPGFELTSGGFRVSPGGGSLLRFAQPVSQWKRKEGSDRMALWDAVAGPGAPQSLRLHSRSLGFDLRVKESFQLRFTTTSAPFLTTQEATYDGVSSPHSRWVMVTFKELQPSLVFGFLDGTSNARIKGRPGDWVLEFGPAYSGWIRVAAPFGTKPLPGSGPIVGRLGAAAGLAQRHHLAWARPPVRTLSHRVSMVQGQLAAEWVFDRAGALIPPSLIAAMSASGITSPSPFEILNPNGPHGPIALTLSPRLEFRFPIRPFSGGRRLMPKLRPGLSVAAQALSAEYDPLKRVQLLAEAAQRYRNMPRRRVPGANFTAFLAQTQEEHKASSDTALAHAKALGILGMSSQFNLALTSALWARDPYLLTVPGGSAVQETVANACLLSPELDRQLEGALLAGSLVGQAEVARRSDPGGGSTPPPLGPELAWLSGHSNRMPGWMAASRSPLQVLEGPPCWVRRSTKGWVVCWHASAGEAQRVALAGRLPLVAVPIGNAARFSSQRTSGGVVFTLRAERLGLCEVLIKPESGKPLDFPSWPAP